MLEQRSGTAELELELGIVCGLLTAFVTVLGALATTTLLIGNCAKKAEKGK